MVRYMLTALILGAGLCMPIAASANDYRVVIRNQTSDTMTSLRIRHIGNESIPSGDWSGNILDDDLDPGDQAMVIMSDGLGWCRFHVLATFSNGAKAHTGDFNACTQVLWTAVDGDD